MKALIIVDYYISLKRGYRLYVHHQVRTVGEIIEVKIDHIVRVRHIERRLGLCVKNIHFI